MPPVWVFVSQHGFCFSIHVISKTRCFIIIVWRLSTWHKIFDRWCSEGNPAPSSCFGILLKPRLHLINFDQKRLRRSAEKLPWLVARLSYAHTPTYTHTCFSPSEWMNKSRGSLIPPGDRCHFNLSDERTDGSLGPTPVLLQYRTQRNLTQAVIIWSNTVLDFYNAVDYFKCCVFLTQWLQSFH